MNTPRNNPLHRASTLVVALVIMAIGSIGMAALLELIHSRGMQVQAMEDATQRRLREMNGREFAREFAGRLIRKEIGSAGGSYELAGKAGRITVPAWSGSDFDKSNIGAVNHFSHYRGAAASEASFDIQVFAHLNADGGWDTSTVSKTYRVNLRGVIPLLAGTPLVMNAAPKEDNSVNSLIEVYGDAWINPTSSSKSDHVFYAQGFNAAAAVLEKGDYLVAPPGGSFDTNAIAPYNFPFLYWENHYDTASGGSYDATLDVVDGPNLESLAQIAKDKGAVVLEGEEEMDSKGVKVKKDGKIEIELDREDLPHLIVRSNIKEVKLEGQKDDADISHAASLAPVMLIFIEDDDSKKEFNKLEFKESNGRPLIVGIKKVSGPKLKVDLKKETTWRGVFYIENVRFELKGDKDGGQIMGGIVTDRQLEGDKEPVPIIPENNTTILSQLPNYLPQQTWVETYLVP